MRQSHTARVMTVVIALIAAEVRADTSYNLDAPATEIATVTGSWNDNTRNREIPYKIYYPKTLAGKLPIIIFSHGLGGSREGYSYLGKYWASHGYISVHLTHHGSDTAAVFGNGADDAKAQARTISQDPMNAVDRVVDVKCAIDKLTESDGDDSFPIKDHLDLSRIGMSGHSFGANTTMLISGEMSRSGRIFSDDRIKCAIALSPPVAVSKAMYEKVYSNIAVPLFVVTGTKDDSPVGETMAADRRIPFDHVVNIPAFLITFDGAAHMTFSGPRRLAASNPEAHTHKLVQQGTTAFWDAFLRGDDSAKSWFSGEGYSNLVGADGVFEKKPQGK